ncbi:MAG: fibronectin type III domain-containing protein, partial [Gammaproteobacteria bacterium]|nr:fibronectin type III domain-containing protein [Gammaproteobacteria bacterium]
MKKVFKIFTTLLLMIILVVGTLVPIASAAGTPQTPPPNLVATGISATQIQLTWGSVSGATKYDLYRATSQYGSYSPVGSSTTLSYTDNGLTNNTHFYYLVFSANSYGEGADSLANAWTLSGTPQTPPPNLVATGISATQIQLTWGSVSG